MKNIIKNLFLKSLPEVEVHIECRFFSLHLYTLSGTPTDTFMEITWNGKTTVIASSETQELWDYLNSPEIKARSMAEMKARAEQSWEFKECGMYPYWYEQILAKA